MLRKKGMSPLIATILLLALAVALGSSLVSYAGFYFQTKPANTTIGCKYYVINFLGLDKSKELCTTKFKTTLALKILDKNKKLTENECYSIIASGSSNICNLDQSLVDNTWITYEKID